MILIPLLSVSRHCKWQRLLLFHGLFERVHIRHKFPLCGEMAPEDERDLIEAVVTCEGNLHDPDFSDRFQSIVTKLKSILYTTSKKQPFQVRKIEPWNSVRVTISIPKEAAQRLRLLAQQGSNVLRQLGILSVQVEGDQVISLTLAGRFNEPQEVILRQSDEVANSSGSSSATSSTSSLCSTSSSTASTPIPAPVVPAAGPSGVMVSLDILSSTTSSAFRSPNVVAPSGESIPLPPKNVAVGPRSTLGGPFPFASMTHAAHTIQRSETGNSTQIPSVTNSTNSNTGPPSNNANSTPNPVTTVLAVPLSSGTHVRNNPTKVTVSSAIPPSLTAQHFNAPVRKNNNNNNVNSPNVNVVSKPQPVLVTAVVNVKNSNNNNSGSSQNNGNNSTTSSFIPPSNPPNVVVVVNSTSFSKPAQVQGDAKLNPSQQVQHLQHHSKLHTVLKTSVAGVAHSLGKDKEPTPPPGAATNPQLTSSGKPRQFLINPLTGHLEPMPSESSSESEGDDDGRTPNSGVHPKSSSILKSSKGKDNPSLIAGWDKPKPVKKFNRLPNTSSSVGVISRKVSREDLEATPLAKENSVAHVNNTNPVDKIKKLRLKLEKTESISPSTYKMDISYVKKSEKSSVSTVMSSSGASSTLSGQFTTSPASTVSSGSNTSQSIVSSQSDVPRVPPLHISLRGKNAAVVVSPRRDDSLKDLPSGVSSSPSTVTPSSQSEKLVASLNTQKPSSAIANKRTKIRLKSSEGDSVSSKKASKIVQSRPVPLINVEEREDPLKARLQSEEKLNSSVALEFNKATVNKYSDLNSGNPVACANAISPSTTSTGVPVVNKVKKHRRKSEILSPRQPFISSQSHDRDANKSPNTVVEASQLLKLLSQHSQQVSIKSDGELESFGPAQPSATPTSLGTISSSLISCDSDNEREKRVTLPPTSSTAVATATPKSLSGALVTATLAVGIDNYNTPKDERNTWQKNASAFEVRDIPKQIQGSSVGAEITSIPDTKLSISPCDKPIPDQVALPLQQPNLDIKLEADASQSSVSLPSSTQPPQHSTTVSTSISSPRVSVSTGNVSVLLSPATILSSSTIGTVPTSQSAIVSSLVSELVKVNPAGRPYNTHLVSTSLSPVTATSTIVSSRAESLQSLGTSILNQMLTCSKDSTLQVLPRTKTSTLPTTQCPAVTCGTGLSFVSPPNVSSAILQSALKTSPPVSSKEITPPVQFSSLQRDKLTRLDGVMSGSKESSLPKTESNPSFTSSEDLKLLGPNRGVEMAPDDRSVLLEYEKADPKTDMVLKGNKTVLMRSELESDRETETGSTGVMAAPASTSSYQSQEPSPLRLMTLTLPSTTNIISSSLGVKPEESGGIPGEDSGIDSMDALSEKSPNQGESPARKSENDHHFCDNNSNLHSHQQQQKNSACERPGNDCDNGGHLQLTESGASNTSATPNRSTPYNEREAVESKMEVDSAPQLPSTTAILVGSNTSAPNVTMSGITATTSISADNKEVIDSREKDLSPVRKTVPLSLPPTAPNVLNANATTTATTLTSSLPTCSELQFRNQDVFAANVVETRKDLACISDKIVKSNDTTNSVIPSDNKSDHPNLGSSMDSNTSTTNSVAIAVSTSLKQRQEPKEICTDAAGAEFRNSEFFQQKETFSPENKLVSSVLGKQAVSVTLSDLPANPGPKGKGSVLESTKNEVKCTALVPSAQLTHEVVTNVVTETPKESESTLPTDMETEKHQSNISTPVTEVIKGVEMIPAQPTNKCHQQKFTEETSTANSSEMSKSEKQITSRNHLDVPRTNLTEPFEKFEKAGDQSSFTNISTENLSMQQKALTTDGKGNSQEDTPMIMDTEAVTEETTARISESLLKHSGNDIELSVDKSIIDNSEVASKLGIATGNNDQMDIQLNKFNADLGVGIKNADVLVVSSDTQSVDNGKCLAIEGDINVDKFLLEEKSAVERQDVAPSNNASSSINKTGVVLANPAKHIDGMAAAKFTAYKHDYSVAANVAKSEEEKQNENKSSGNESKSGLQTCRVKVEAKPQDLFPPKSEYLTSVNAGKSVTSDPSPSSSIRIGDDKILVSDSTVVDTVQQSNKSGPTETVARIPANTKSSSQTVAAISLSDAIAVADPELQGNLEPIVPTLAKSKVNQPCANEVDSGGEAHAGVCAGNTSSSSIAYRDVKPVVPTQAVLPAKVEISTPKATINACQSTGVPVNAMFVTNESESSCKGTTATPSVPTVGEPISSAEELKTKVKVDGMLARVSNTTSATAVVNPSTKSHCLNAKDDKMQAMVHPAPNHSSFMLQQSHQQAMGQQKRQDMENKFLDGTKILTSNSPCNLSPTSSNLIRGCTTSRKDIQLPVLIPAPNTSVRGESQVPPLNAQGKPQMPSITPVQKLKLATLTTEASVSSPEILNTKFNAVTTTAAGGVASDTPVVQPPPLAPILIRPNFQGSLFTLDHHHQNTSATLTTPTSNATAIKQSQLSRGQSIEISLPTSTGKMEMKPTSMSINVPHQRGVTSNFIQLTKAAAANLTNKVPIAVAGGAQQCHQVSPKSTPSSISVSLAPISGSATLGNATGTPTVFAIHPHQYHHHQQSITVLPSGHKMVPIKLVTIPKQNQAQLPLQVGGTNRSSPTVLETVNIVAAPSRSSSPNSPVNKGKVHHHHGNSVQNSPLNLSSVSGGNLHLVPLAVSSAATGTSSPMKVLVSSPMKMQPNLLQSMISKGQIVMANQNQAHPTIRVVRPIVASQDLEDPPKLEIIDKAMYAQHQAQVRQQQLHRLLQQQTNASSQGLDVKSKPVLLVADTLSKSSPIASRAAILSLGGNSTAAAEHGSHSTDKQSIYERTDGIQILNTEDSNEDELFPFEADIIHDEKDLEDILADENVCVAENGLEMDLLDGPYNLDGEDRDRSDSYGSKNTSRSDSHTSRNLLHLKTDSASFNKGNDNHSVSRSPSAVVTSNSGSSPAVSKTSSPTSTAFSTGSTLDADLDKIDSPIPAIRASSPLYTYSNRSARNSHSTSESRSPSPPEPDVHGEDQEIIDCLSRSPSQPKLSPQNKPLSAVENDNDYGSPTKPDLHPDHTYVAGSSGSSGDSNNSSVAPQLEQLSIEIPPVDLMAMSPAANSSNEENRKHTRSTRSNTRLVSPDITAFRSDTPKPTKFTNKPDALILKNSPKPSPTGSIKTHSPGLAGGTQPSTSARASPVSNQLSINSNSSINSLTGRNSPNASVANPGGGALKANVTSGCVTTATAFINKRKRQESDSSNASKDENSEDKIDIDLNSRPGKRRCSENAAELIKACIGVEDTPKRNSSLIKKLELQDNKLKEMVSAKGKKPIMSVVVEEAEDDLESIDLLNRGRTGGRSSRGSSEDRSSSRGSSVHRQTGTPKPIIKEEENKDAKAINRVNNRTTGSKDIGNKSKVSGRDSPSSNVISKKEESKQSSVGRRSNRNAPTKEKSPLTLAKTRTNVRKDLVLSTGAEKSVTPSTSPENGNPRRKTRSSVAGGASDSMPTFKRRRISKDTKS